MDQNSNKNIGLGLGICYLKSEGNPRLDFGFFSLPYHTDFCLKRDTKILDLFPHTKARVWTEKIDHTHGFSHCQN